MKIIRSNKKGFRIHSPFVYELVTNVLYNDSKNIDFAGIGISQTAKQVQLNLLCRLLNYFNPEKVFFYRPLSAEIEHKLKNMANSDFFYPVTLNDDLEENIIAFPFVVLNEPIFNKLTHSPKNSSVWFITKDPCSGSSIFQNLLECERGIITIELKYSGIVIFNNKFYTQGYIIK